MTQPFCGTVINPPCLTVNTEVADPSSPSPSEATRNADYRHECQRHEHAALTYDRHARLLTMLSRICLGIAAALVLIAWQTSESRFVCLALAMIAGIGFAALSTRIDRVRANSDRARLSADINAQGAARISRQWDVVSDVVVEDGPQDQQTAIDLDLFGHVSLMKLICTARTSVGVAKLTAWLAQQNSESEIADRRRIAHELAPCLEWRQQHETL